MILLTAMPAIEPAKIAIKPKSMKGIASPAAALPSSRSTAAIKTMAKK